MLKVKQFLMVFFLITYYKQQTLLEQRQKYCQSAWDPVGKSDSQKESQRSKIQNYFSTRFQDTIDYYVNNNSTSILASFAPLAAFIIIFLILSFISIILFVLLFLKRFQLQEETIRKQLLLTASIIFLLIFIVLFIVYLIFFSFAQNKVKDIRCGLYLLPSSFIDGIGTQDDMNQQIKFIGAKGMQQIYQNLNNEIPNLTKNQIDFKRIKDSDLTGSTNTAYQSLEFFRQKFMNKKTVDNQNTQKVPFTAQLQQPYSIMNLQSEFNELAQLGQKSNQAVVEGYRIINNVSGFQKAIQNTNQILTISISLMEQFFLNIAKKANKGLQYINGSSIALLVFCILGIIISCIIIFILLKITKQQELLNQKQLARILISVLMVIVFTIFLINIFLGIGSSSVSGFCYFLANISEGNINYLQNLKPGINPFVLSIIQTCYSPNGDGNISKLLNNDNEIFLLQDKSLNNFVEGISMNQYYYQQPENPLGSQQLSTYLIQISEFQVGQKYDHFNIQESLDNLNSLISCNNNSFQLNSNSCESNSNCLGIYETDSFQAPSCSQDEQRVNQIFDNLKGYLNQENNLIEEMKRELTEPKYSSAKSFKKSEEIFEQVRSNFQNIQKSIPNTLSSFQSYNRPLHQIQNCQALQIQIDQYEEKLCFQYSKYVFTITILNFFLGVVLFILAWILCWAFRGDETFEPSQIDLNETQEINLKDTDFVISQFEEDEKVPRSCFNML